MADRRPELRAYLAKEFPALFANADFESALAGHLLCDAASQGRLGKMANTLRKFTSL